MSEINTGLSFAAGLLSFLSPCVLPLVPGYISYISGKSLESLSHPEPGAWKKTAATSVFFVAGFAFIFTVLGASASAVGRLLLGQMFILTKAAGVIIVLFGLHTLGVIQIPVLYYQKRFNTSRVGAGFGGAFAMGAAFAFGWTPCIGPILAGILALAATEETVSRGMFLLFIYSMGLGIPFILTGFGVNAFMAFFARYKRFVRAGEIAAGLMLVAAGLLIFFNKLIILASWMPSFLNRFAK